MGQGKANPTGMILSAAMMLTGWPTSTASRVAAEAGERIERAVDKAYLPMASSRWNSAQQRHADIAKAVLRRCRRGRGEHRRVPSPLRAGLFILIRKASSQPAR